MSDREVLIRCARTGHTGRLLLLPDRLYKMLYGQQHNHLLQEICRKTQFLPLWQEFLQDQIQ